MHLPNRGSSKDVLPDRLTVAEMVLQFGNTVAGVKDAILRCHDTGMLHCELIEMETAVQMGQARIVTGTIDENVIVGKAVHAGEVAKVDIRQIAQISTIAITAPATAVFKDMLRLMFIFCNREMAT